MKLGRAYETLKDETKRREYDSIYPTITRPPPSSTPQSGALSEAAQIAALQKLKQERTARWRSKKEAFKSSIFELQKGIRQLEQEIKNLDSIVAAEAAAEAQNNSWGTWFLSPIYKTVKDTEEEKERKDRESQERKAGKDMKEGQLGVKNTDLKKEESLLRNAKDEVDTANLDDDWKIRVIEEGIWAREHRERQEKERERQEKEWERQEMERERQEKERERQENERIEREIDARILKQQQEQREKREQERLEALNALCDKERAAEQRRREEQARQRQKIADDQPKAYREQYMRPNLVNLPKGCCHYGWWPRIQGRTACPKCNEVWTYLLQCPTCMMKACPECQCAILLGEMDNPVGYDGLLRPK